jgi:hypothetical protein
MASDEEMDERYEQAGVRAQELAGSGQVEEAERIARSIPNADAFCGWFHEKTVAFIAIASALVESGLTDRALGIAREAVSFAELMGGAGTWHGPDALVDIGQVMLRAGARDEGIRLWMKAVALCQECQDHDEDCGKILSQIAGLLTDIGLIDEALRVAASIRFERLHRKTLNEIRNRRRGYAGRGVPD